MDYLWVACGVEIRDKSSDCRMCPLKEAHENENGGDRNLGAAWLGPNSSGCDFEESDFESRRRKLQYGMIRYDSHLE